MALPELLQALRVQAAERRAEELARADAEAALVRGESRASLERRKIEHVERVVRDANEAARRAVSEARSEAAVSILKARDRLLGRVRVALEERGRASIADPALHAWLPAVLAGALERLPPGDVVVRVRPELARVLAQAIADRRGITLESIPDMGAGFVAVSAESGVEIDATLETNLLHRWPQIAVSVLAEIRK